MTGFAMAEQDRRGRATIMLGSIIEADYPSALVRAELGDLTSGWMPWITRRAGGDRDWWAPEIGEQVVVLAPGGELDQAVCLGAIYQATHAAPASSPDIHRTDYADGSFIEMNRGTGDLTISVTGNVTITAAGNVSINGQRIDLN